jgi:hypothetical protein
MAYWDAFGPLWTFLERPAMTWIDRLDARFGRFAVPHLTEFLIAGQVLAFVANMSPAEEGGKPLLDSIRFAPDKVLAGEWWRLITFLFDPPLSIPIFAFFFWYLFYLMGTTLEAQWGTFRYNLFLLLGYVASIVMGFVVWFAVGVAGQTATNGFLYGTVFLAFARLYPDFTMYLFFVLPVKIRWLALLQWIVYGMTMVNPTSTWLDRGMVIAAVFNYLVFFGRDILRDMKQGQRRMKFQAQNIKGTKKGPQIKHVCHVCGLTNAESPKTAFRYCMECGGEYCYCPEHLANHEHVNAKGAV